MGYFAGGGSGKGWHLFYFILTPDEFQRLFDELTFSFIGTGSRVDADYKETRKDEVFQAYKDFFEQILIGQDILSAEQHWKIERPIRKSIIDNIDKVSFVDIRDEKGNLTPFRLVEPLEAVINIDPFYLHWSAEKEKLSISIMNEPGVIGLRLSFPKYITWYNQNSSDTKETSLYETSSLFDTLVKRIKAFSRKAKVEWSGKQYRPDFWISPNASESIHKNKYLRANGLTIK